MAVLLILFMLVPWLKTSRQEDACVERELGRVKCSNLSHAPHGISRNAIQLDMSGNSLTSLPRDFFEKLTKLQEINLSENLLTSIPRGLFSNLKSLILIYLNDNQISGAFYLPHSVKHIELYQNQFSLEDVRIILGGTTKATHVDISYNPIGPKLTADIFAGFHNMTFLCIAGCDLEHIESGTFTAMKDLRHLDLSSNRLSHMDGSILGGPGEKLLVLDLRYNNIASVAEGAFYNFTLLRRLRLEYNQIEVVPDLPRSANLFEVYLSNNRIKAFYRRSTLPRCMWNLDLSFNSLQEIPDGVFSGGAKLFYLLLNSNNISRLTGQSFLGLPNLKFLTLFDNPISSLPDGIFQHLSQDAIVTITCKNLHNLPRLGNSTINCAPSISTYFVSVHGFLHSPQDNLLHSGLVCERCTPDTGPLCINCTFCNVGTHCNLVDSCLTCPAGGFYQDAIGQTECKTCSYGTYVSEDRAPGKSATDCWACPYGTLTNETAGYRACKCLPNFYRTDRFGPCSPCPKNGVVCANDTAILAPNYYWNWTSEAHKNNFEKFVENVFNHGSDYNKTYSKFEGSLPLPHKCPRMESCKGGIDSECHVGYKGLLCASCTRDHYSRMNTCLKCPSKARAIISFVGVVVIVAVVFLAIFLGDSKKAANHRTWADVIMSCFKIIIGFYQVMSGIFSALVRIRWPVTVLTIATWLKFVEGNILQFAPLSCIYPSLRFDPFVDFAIAVSVNLLAVVLILGYLLLKSLYIENKNDLSDDDKRNAISNLKKSCYRNIFLFLLTLYPSTAFKIARIIPNACVEMCFTKDQGQCDSFLRADLSIRCFTSRHNMFWHFAVVSALYPVGFPLLLLFLLYNFYRKPVGRRLASLECRTDDQEERKNLRALVPQDKQEIAFGLSVFFENYRFGCWYWEILEMYRKLLLTSGLLIFTPESRSRIGFSVITASTFGIVYTSFRPIKSKFEDLLQTVSLWVVFFDVCFAAIFADADVPSPADLKRENDSVFANILFVVLNCLVLIIALVNGVLHVKSSWRKLSGCIKKLFWLQWKGVRHLGRQRGYHRLP